MHSRTIVIMLCGMALLALAGCGLFRNSSQPGGGSGASTALTGHNAVSIQNYKVAREYSAQGRFELAREHYLLAYAAAEDDAALRAALERELRAVSMMIQTLR